MGLEAKQRVSPHTELKKAKTDLRSAMPSHGAIDHRPGNPFTKQKGEQSHSVDLIWLAI